MRYGIYWPLLLGAVLVPVTNLFFVWLAVSEPDLVSLAVVISVDNLSGGFATSAFIAYLSSLTNTTYTADPYALFSSLMTLPAKIIGGFRYRGRGRRLCLVLPLRRPAGRAGVITYHLPDEKTHFIRR